MSDLLDIRARKLKELEFYNQQLKELQLKMVFIQQEIHLTNKIINMIEKEQIIEVEFDKTIDEALLANLTNIKTYKNTSDNIWILTFNTEEDMRPKVFDFAQEYGLKTLQISLRSKNLEQIFREKTKKKQT